MRDGIGPTPQPGAASALALALLVHGLLLLALTWGVSWQHDTPRLDVQAELWASVPQHTAAPAQSEPPPPVVAPRSAPPKVDIPIAQEKPKPARRTEKPLPPPPKPPPPKPAPPKPAPPKPQRVPDDARLEQLRQQNLARIAGLAGATAPPNARGTATQSAGLSASYKDRLRARIRPQVVFSEPVSGNPLAEVEVVVAADGRILSGRLLKRSGVPGWDEAVLRGIEKTGVLPRDSDGRMPSPLVIEFTPKDD